MGVAAIILLTHYPKIRDRTYTAGDAFGAFLTLCVIFGSLGPLVTLAFFAGQRLVRRSFPRGSGNKPLFGSPAGLSRNCNKTVLKDVQCDVKKLATPPGWTSCRWSKP